MQSADSAKARKGYASTNPITRPFGKNKTVLVCCVHQDRRIRSGMSLLRFASVPADAGRDPVPLPEAGRQVERDALWLVEVCQLMATRRVRSRVAYSAGVTVGRIARPRVETAPLSLRPT